MVQRKTYDTRVKYLVMKGLLPDLYRRQIHKSLISKWQRESPEKYTGYELNDNIEELYELMKKIAEDLPHQKRTPGCAVFDPVSAGRTPFAVTIGLNRAVQF